VLDGKRIEFMVDGERYEWLSSDSILPNGGTWNLWVLRDTGYTPMFGGPAIAPPRSTQKGPSVLEKIEGALEKRGAEVTFNVPRRVVSSKSTTLVPLRVMVGGADSMENLLPKSAP